jgi:hypothetical protein
VFVLTSFILFSKVYTLGNYERVLYGVFLGGFQALGSALSVFFLPITSLFFPIFLLDFFERTKESLVTWKAWLIFSFTIICLPLVTLLSSVQVRDFVQKAADPCYEIVMGKGPIWSIKKGRVCMEYYENALGYTSLKTLRGADSETFQKVESSFYYFKDKNAVYYKGTKIEEADPITVRTLKDEYIRDKDHVWYHDQRVPNADPRTFQVLGNYYAKTDKHVYIYGKLIQEANSETFEVLPDLYAKDKNAVYNDGKKFYNANPETFHEIGNSGFYTDGKVLYYLTYPVHDANPTTFRVLKGSCGTDDVYYFYGDKKVQDKEGCS